MTSGIADCVVAAPIHAAWTTPIKLYGLPGACALLVRELLCANFHVQIVNEGETAVMAEDLSNTWWGRPNRFVLCVQDPYGWLYGQWHSRWEQAKAKMLTQDAPGFCAFLKTAWAGAANPVARWNGMNRHWLSSLPEDRTVLARREDLVGAFAQILQLKLWALAFRLTHIDGRYRWLPQELDGDERLCCDAYYRERRWLAGYGPEELYWVNAALDRQVLERLGYGLVEGAALRDAPGGLRRPAISRGPAAPEGTSLQAGAGGGNG